MNFAELTAPEIRCPPRDSTLIIAPIAAMEQHGPHLPVSTDTILAGAVAEGVEKALGDRALVLPVLWLGASDHHLPRGGTLTSPLPTYEQVLVDLLTPLLRDGFRRVLILNGHGGNIDPLRVALRRLDVDFPRAILTGAAYWDLADRRAGRALPRASQGDGPRLRDRDVDDDAPPARPRPARPDQGRSRRHAARPPGAVLAPRLRPADRPRRRRLPRAGRRGARVA